MDEEENDDISTSPARRSLQQKSSEDVFEEEPIESISTGISSYQIKPTLQNKFKELPVKEIIRNVVASVLTGLAYDPDRAKNWSMSISNEVNDKVRDLQMKRYKHIVQVIIGEMKGAGVKSAVRCVWDSDVDGYTSDIFINDTIFCVTTVFAIYLY
ncbi:dynein light chain Tctex-type protein 2B [Diabrotica virgifera virgifera]|uniref:Tctex1 domain-containing protein 2-like n=1 Tax=Diabrotica virgifera virgifera TaxID=50390 RepID=A0A6P7EZU5_DIAVI|nr:dynein light chain Tctex-type protein 2B [Diabrotica virgifera virgifera]